MLVCPYMRRSSRQAAADGRRCASRGRPARRQYVMKQMGGNSAAGGDHSNTRSQREHTGGFVGG